MQTKQVSVAVAEPLTLDEARRQLQIVAADTSFDTLITDLIPVVREAAENETALDLRPATYETSLDRFRSVMVLPRNPVTAITSVTYLDIDGVQQTLTADADFVLDLASKPARIYFSNTPATNGKFNAVKITYSAGFALADVPKTTKHGMKMLLTHYFENRGTVADGRYTEELPLGVKWLFQKDRIY